MENTDARKVKKTGMTFFGKPASGIRIGLSSAACFSGCAVLILMPYLIYKYGAGAFWCALGFFMGLITVWKFLPYRMFRFSRKGEDIVSFSDYLRIRLGKGSRALSVTAAMAFTLFSLFFSVQMFRLGRELFDSFTGGVGIWMRVVSLGLLLPILIIGFSLIIRMGRPVAILILAVLFLMAFIMFQEMGGSGTVRYTMMSGVPNTVSEYMNILFFEGEKLTVAKGINLFMSGFLFAGLPVSFPFFVNMKDIRQVKKAKKTVFAWSFPAFVLSCFVGGLSRAYLYVEGEANSTAEYMTKLYRALKHHGTTPRVIGILYVVAVLVAYLLLLYFIFHRLITEVYAVVSWIDEKNPKKLIFSIAISWSLLVLIEFRMPEISWGSVFFVMKFWACAAGAVMFSSLVMRRLGTPAAVAGILLGSLGMVIPELLPEAVFESRIAFFFGPEGAGTEIMSLILSVLGIILFSRLFPEKDQDVLTRFDEVKNRIG